MTITQKLLMNTMLLAFQILRRMLILLSIVDDILPRGWIQSQRRYKPKHIGKPGNEMAAGPTSTG